MQNVTQAVDNPYKQEVCFLFNKNYEKVIMIKMKKPAWGKGLFNGPGGKRKIGESGKDCIAREIKEEIDFDVDKDTLVLRGKIFIPHWDVKCDLPLTIEIGIWCGIIENNVFDKIKSNNNQSFLPENENLPYIYPTHVFDRDCSVENVPIILNILSSYQNNKEAPFFRFDYKTNANENKV